MFDEQQLSEVDKAQGDKYLDKHNLGKKQREELVQSETTAQGHACRPWQCHGCGCPGERALEDCAECLQGCAFLEPLPGQMKSKQTLRLDLVNLYCSSG